MALYQCIKFHFIPLYIISYALDKMNIAKFKKGSNSVNTGDKVMILAFCTFSDNPLSMYQFSFNSLLYFQKDAPEKVLIAKFLSFKVSNSVNTVDRVKFLAMRNFADGPLSTYQVSFNSLAFFQRYAPDKLFYCKN